MSNFIKIESYKHKCAKEVFKKWCDEKVPENSDWKFFTTNFKYNNGTNVEIGWRSNRGEDAWLEYPIVCNKNINSIQCNWDEIWEYGIEGWNGSVPTFEACIKNGLYPSSVIDIVLPHKGHPKYLIEICHTNPVSDEKVKKLRELGVENLIEIDAEWILTQTDVPSEIEIKRWLI